MEPIAALSCGTAALGCVPLTQIAMLPAEGGWAT
jgi:hypothetical protein